MDNLLFALYGICLALGAVSALICIYCIGIVANGMI